MLKLKKRHNKPAKSDAKPGFDLPVVLSLAGIVSVIAAIGLAALNGKMTGNGASNLTGMTGSTGTMIASDTPDITTEIARLDKKLADIATLLKTLTSEQVTTISRVEKIEEAFTSTASISPKAIQNPSPYFRIQETGWDADDMVTRTQKRDRTALLRTPTTTTDRDQKQTGKDMSQSRYAVDLSSYENIITARNRWDKFKLIYPDLFLKLEPNLLPVVGKKDEKGRVRLVVGPIKTATKAAQICSVLRSNGLACKERVFSSSNITVVSAPEASPVKSTE